LKANGKPIYTEEQLVILREVWESVTDVHKLEDEELDNIACGIDLTVEQVEVSSWKTAPK
jgi:hypothetical protein